jgi:hypothetical protein
MFYLPYFLLFLYSTGTCVGTGTRRIENLLFVSLSEETDMKFWTKYDGCDTSQGKICILGATGTGKNNEFSVLGLFDLFL